MNKKMLIDILTVLGAYTIMFGATYFMWIGAECVLEKAAHVGTVDCFFAAYFAWSITRAIAKAGKKVAKNNETEPV